MFKQVTVINAVIIYKKLSLKLKLCFLCSLRSLKREREFLAKRLTTRMTTEERELLYRKWDVPLEGKQRRIQFINKLWTNPHDSAHVQESAEIVAKLVGFREGGNLSKEMFELNFVLASNDRPWLMETYRNIVFSLNYFSFFAVVLQTILYHLTLFMLTNLLYF